MNKELILNEIWAERRHQDEKWGVQNHGPDHWMVILLEELGEAAETILEGDLVKYHHELIQVAAVAVAALEALHRYDVLKVAK